MKKYSNGVDPILVCTTKTTTTTYLGQAFEVGMAKHTHTEMSRISRPCWPMRIGQGRNHDGVITRRGIVSRHPRDENPRESFPWYLLTLIFIGSALTLYILKNWWYTTHFIE